jgi:predicted AlkP superfamily pyrophosphatase or phosphodiesterase
LHLFRSLSFAAVAFALSSNCLLAAPPKHHAVLVISIDGLRPDAVLHAEEHSLKIPVLRSFLRDGVYAEAVHNVVPTYTYPNHTTLITGVWPSVHGIYNNTPFDPEGKENGRWNWYAGLVKAPTLWQAAHDAGLTTASLHWPVTMNAKGIDYNVPEFWFSRTESDHFLIEAISQPRGYLEKLEQTAGIYFPGGSDIAYDERLTKTAIALIQDKHPDLLTLHIVSLDHVEHAHGPFSAEANEDLEQIDGMVGRLIKAEQTAHPDASIAVVSDHGFLPVLHIFNLNLALAKAGLIRIEKGKLKSWDAAAWESGGTAMIILKDPNDTSVMKKTGDVLKQLATDPSNGISTVLSHDEAVKLGATNDAAFLVDMKTGYRMGAALKGPVVENLSNTSGAHGFLPNLHPELRSSFFLIGANSRAGKNLGTIDMRQIAPTLAGLLGVSLPSAHAAPLDLR